MDLATVHQLASPQGWSLLAALPPYDENHATALNTELRNAGYPADLIAAALTQSRLRAKAADKFGEFADGMLFTPDALEQATRLEIAAHHAHRYVRANIHHIHDLGCGIGSDAMTFASLGIAVTAIDADPATAALAALNLRHFPHAEAHTGLAEDTPLPTDTTHTGIWLDPARRDTTHSTSSGKATRLHNLDTISPPWSFVESVAAQIPATGAKLSPAFPRNRIPAGTQAEWTSLHGDVLECAIWWGPLAEQPGRTATILGNHPPIHVHQNDTPTTHSYATTLPSEGTHLYEPDKAIIAADLTGALTTAVDGTELAPHVGYVASPNRTELPWATRYTVIAAMKPNPKHVRAWLRKRGSGRLTLKRRGGRITPETFRRELKLDGHGPETIGILTSVADSPAFLIVERDCTTTQ
ncbi:Uncharacterised protein [Dermatophilus congolensis]|uniref:THUMP-like domain-containing protein n=1 Tax=Dermatophilus congolensis TaxID=1863 RepID=A0AA46BL61_9MICO|nr:class I SAM-dependent methyltransferase [Dermatophilus congolensis]STD03071.1 Uncharacterised protein [Dermatophilus congolensis]